MKWGFRYSFVHLPVVAPSMDMLKWWRSDKPAWQTFRDQYSEELSESAVRVAADFISLDEPPQAA
jgi:uncharacterized protein YeaO (DUF488 family)